MGKSAVIRRILMPVIILWLCECAQAQGHKQKTYELSKNGISEASLNNYLSRAVTMAEFLTVDPYNIDGSQSKKNDDIRLIHNIGAKFIGRAIYRWCKESSFNQPQFLSEAAKLIKKVHLKDPEIIFQAAVFEAVSTEVNELDIPAWVFQALDRKPEQRKFSYLDMLNSQGKLVNQWGPGKSVPDITHPETQLWFMFLSGTYLNLGCESLHLGQTTLIGMEDKDLSHWAAFIEKVRRYASVHARRQWVLLDSHATEGGMILNGKSLLDFNSFPLRIKEDVARPKEAVLAKGYIDAYYGRSKACITPSGWYSKSLPYLLEFDNYGVSNKPGLAGAEYFVWGYDEITWFYLQKEKYRQEWLGYADRWIKHTDPNGHLQMPITRIITLGGGAAIFKNFGNNKSRVCPEGMNLETAIKKIWGNDK